MAKQHPLRAWRQEHNLTQAAAAKLARVHWTTWQRWESEKHPPITRHLLALTRLTGIDVARLIGA